MGRTELKFIRASAPGPRCPQRSKTAVTFLVIIKDVYPPGAPTTEIRGAGVNSVGREVGTRVQKGKGRFGGN